MHMKIMIMKRTVFMLVCLVSNCLAENGFVVYKNISLNQGHHCAINDVLFTQYFGTFNRCLFECKTHPICQQFFFKQDKRYCMGCSSQEVLTAPYFIDTERYGIDECSSRDSPCLNGGVCDDNSCTCAEGYEGTNCETVTPPVYIGCFQNPGDNRIMDEYSTSHDSMTNEMCARICLDRSFKYSGTEVGNWCMCGDSYRIDAEELTDGCHFLEETCCKRVEMSGSCHSIWHRVKQLKK